MSQMDQNSTVISTASISNVVPENFDITSYRCGQEIPIAIVASISTFEKKCFLYVSHYKFPPEVISEHSNKCQIILIILYFIIIVM
jgi:hypothetical protein